MEDFANEGVPALISTLNDSASALSSSTQLPSNLTDAEQLELFISAIRDEVFVELVAFVSLFIVGATSNLWIFYKLSRTTNKTRMNYLLRHLTFADLMVVFGAIFTEIVWRLSISWNAGLFLCKFLNTLRAFTLYLSSNIIVCISLDRFYAFVKPFSVVDATERNNKFLTVAYSVSALMSLPQAFIFHLKQHPHYKEFTQCATGEYFEEWQEMVYSIASVFAMYFIPLIVIVFCYVCILRQISRDSNLQVLDDGGTNTSRATIMDRARRSTLKMTIAIVCTFILCWSPYAFMVIWYQLDKTSAQSLPEWIMSTLFIFAFSSSCVNPFVHSKHLLSDCCANGLRRRTTDGTREHTLDTQIAVAEV